MKATPEGQQGVGARLALCGSSLISVRVLTYVDAACAPGFTRGLTLVNNRQQASRAPPSALLPHVPLHLLQQSYAARLPPHYARAGWARTWPWLAQDSVVGAAVAQLRWRVAVRVRKYRHAAGLGEERERAFAGKNARYSASAACHCLWYLLIRPSSRHGGNLCLSCAQRRTQEVSRGSCKEPSPIKRLLSFI